MSYNLDYLPLEHILLGRWNENFGFTEEIQAFDRAMWAWLEMIPEPVCLIIECDDPAFSESDIMVSAKVFTEGKATFKHPMIKQVVFVSGGAPFNTSAIDINTVSFGDIDVEVFKSLDQALTFIRSVVAA